MNNKTKMLVLKFISSSLILSTSLSLSGCISEDVDINETGEYLSEVSLDKNELIDENGRKYSLIENSDGTETALFEDGQSITFRRSSSGELELISPKNDSDLIDTGLGFLAGMATSYFIYKGLTPPTGHIVGNRYIPDTRPSSISSVDRDSYYNRYIEDIKKKRQTTGGGTVVSPSKGSVDLSKHGNYSSKPSTVTPPSSSAKSGFGSIGVARGSAVSWGEWNPIIVIVR